MIISLLLIGMGLLFNQQTKPPLFNGIFIPQPTPFSSFSLVDHNNKVFNNDNLTGTWSLLSYGYTHCPDICPTTLNVLNKFVLLLEKDPKFNKLQILFYSIDHKRDTVERLGEYIPFFNSNFIGLTHLDNEKGNKNAESFEKSLGLISQLKTIEDKKNTINPAEQFNTVEEPEKKTSLDEPYTVGHGVMLYLINPQGNLQAVFKPFVGRGQIQYFTQKQVYKDYIKVREYFVE